MRSRDRVVISWPDPGDVAGEFALALIELVRLRGQRIEGVLRVEGGLLSRQRNEIVKHFLDDMTADWLFMIDSDETITPQVFDKLIGAAHAEERPVVAGLYFGTWPGNLLPQPVPHLYREAGDGISAAPITDYPADSVIEIDRAGTGALLVHRSVLAAIRDASSDHEGRDWCWFRDLPVGGYWLGEDMYFCRRIKSLGFPIHAHTGAILRHRRRYWLDERQFEAMRLATVAAPVADQLDVGRADR